MTSGPQASAKPRAFPWDDVIAFCLGEMRMAPATMWAATPLEVAAMVRGRRQVTNPGHLPAPRRDEFAALAALYPDVAGSSDKERDA